MWMTYKVFTIYQLEFQIVFKSSKEYLKKYLKCYIYSVLNFGFLVFFTGQLGQLFKVVFLSNKQNLDLLS